MNRAKVVIDSKFPDASFREIWGSQGPKMSESFPPTKINSSFFRAEIFSARTRNKLGRDVTIPILPIKILQYRIDIVTSLPIPRILLIPLIYTHIGLLAN
jgi:hypothetical protein